MAVAEEEEVQDRGTETPCIVLLCSLGIAQKAMQPEKGMHSCM